MLIKWLKIVKNLVSIFGGHDANITFFNGQYYIIEIERLLKKRHTGIYTVDIDLKDNEIVEILEECQNIATF